MTTTRAIFVPALALGFLALGFLADAQRPAEAAPYWPWCSRYATKEAAESCAFSSWEQCMETVSGIGGYCYHNLYAPPEPAPRSDRARRGSRG